MITKPSWRERNQHRLDTFWFAFKFWWAPATFMLIVVALLVFLYRMATRPPAAAVTLDRSEWACTQTARELTYVTPQGIPVNRTTCLQWSRQP